MNMLTKDFTDSVEAQFARLNTDVQKALEEGNVLKAILGDLEQKAARRTGNSGEVVETWGSQVVGAQELKEFSEFSQRKVRPGRVGFELKATLTTGGTSGGPTGNPTYRDGIVAMPQRNLRVRSLIPSIKITSGSFEYPEQTTRTLNAALAPEGTEKAESALGWTMRTGSPKVIAHWIPASRQILEDAPQLQGLIDSELRYGLALVEDAQILTGSGTGENLPGLIPAATAYSAPITITGGTMIDQVGLAVLQATLANFTPTGIVMHPSDWMRICLLKDSAGGYLIGDPVNGGVAGSPPQLFGLPVVPTTSMQVDKFLVGDFAVAATIYDRWETRVEISTEHADFFTRNLVAILAEERLGMAIKQAGALVYGDFGNVT